MALYTNISIHVSATNAFKVDDIREAAERSGMSLGEYVLTAAHAAARRTLAKKSKVRRNGGGKVQPSA